MQIDRLDHVVLTVSDIDATTAFYEKALGMASVSFGNGRRALVFGQQKINLHPIDAPIAPHARHPQPGSADFCLITSLPLDRVAAHLTQVGVVIEEGPVARTGALGSITSLYFRDPDGNLLEVSHYSAS